MNEAKPEPASFAAFDTWLGTPLPPDPIAALRTLRREASREVERLLAFLDATDGDADLEGEFAGFEAVQDGRESYSDDEEPSLGADNPQPGWIHTEDGRTLKDAGMDQRDWGHDHIYAVDAEGEHDGCEPDADDEEGHDQEQCNWDQPLTPWEMNQEEARRPTGGIQIGGEAVTTRWRHQNRVNEGTQDGSRKQLTPLLGERIASDIGN